LELILRVGIDGVSRYFCGIDWRWNVFDLILVIVTLYDQAANLIDVESANLSFLRVMRLLKMLRLLRMIRLLHMFKELRLMLSSMFGSTKPMLWSLVLIWMMSFMFGIFFLQAATNHLADNPDTSTDVKKAIEDHWSSVFVAIITLIKSVTNGNSWEVVADPLAEIGIGYYMIFILYIAFFLFVVTNTITSVFIEATMQMASKDSESIVAEEMKKNEYYIKQLRKFYKKLDEDHTGEIHYEQFQKCMNSPEMMAFAQSLQIDATNVHQFFDILSANGTRPVDLETFVVGCIRLKGASKSIDLVQMMHSLSSTASELKRLHDFTVHQLLEVRHTLKECLSELRQKNQRETPLKECLSELRQKSQQKVQVAD